MFRLTALAALVLGVTPAAAQAQVDARMLRYPDVSGTHITFVYAGDIWVVAREGGTASRLSSPPGEEQYPALLPGRNADRVQRELRWQPGRVRRPRDGRDPAPGDLPSWRRSRAGLDARRQTAAVRVGPREWGRPVQPAVSDGRGRRATGEAPGALRRDWRPVARRAPPGLHHQGRQHAHVEAVPGRSRAGHLGDGPAHAGRAQRDRAPRERRVPDVARGDALLPVRARARAAQQHLEARSRGRHAAAGDAVHRRRRLVAGHWATGHRVSGRVGGSTCWRSPRTSIARCRSRS